ncbi:YedE family putative selenium transporter [Thermophilibacter immobilis]|uniref:YedE-related selenium metabolism membrane protein n=1 Tax=Thermophilibacter immobilis TaxID=2779519 RepID=A0A7S7RU57_9ACTN|nr:YedE family putative selenium transporter [Thermophilibacter immobilis]QOY60243.1 YedE-related selenium metabolism membrane protein [Thermophilibacter immobilis]
MNLTKERATIIGGGLVIGVIAVMLVFFGNPANMGFCVACFIRDTVGGLGLHRAAAVQYIRPEIFGLVLGSFLLAVGKGEFTARGGSAPITRFVLGFCVMVGCLMFLGCPFRMILRLAGGDLNALVGLVGFTAGIAAGTFFLNKGYSLGRTYRASKLEGVIWPIIQVILLVLVIAGPAFIFFTEAGAGPGAKHAAIAISLIAGLIVGAIAQRTRLCMVGGIRDMILFRENKLLMGFIAIFVAALVGNLVLTAATGTSYFNLGFEGQPIAHADGLWNFLGMFLVGFACVLLGGCPLRQLVLSGEGNGDSAIAILGLAVGAAFCHNFGLASSADGTTMAGQIAVVLGLVVVIGIACANTFGKEK